MSRTHIETKGNSVVGYIDDVEVIKLSKTSNGIVTDNHPIIPHREPELYIGLYSRCIDVVSEIQIYTVDQSVMYRDTLIQDAHEASKEVERATMAARASYNRYVEVTKKLRKSLGEGWEVKEKSFESFIEMANQSRLTL